MLVTDILIIMYIVKVVGKYMYICMCCMSEVPKHGIEIDECICYSNICQAVSQ